MSSNNGLMRRVTDNNSNGNLKRIRELTDKLTVSDFALDQAIKLLDEVTDGFWDWRPTTNEEYYSPKFWKILGYDPESQPNHARAWQEKIHPEDLKKAIENFNLHIKTKGKHPYYQSVRYKHKSGFWVRLLCAGRVVEWEKDRPIRMLGIHFIGSECEECPVDDIKNIKIRLGKLESGE